MTSVPPYTPLEQRIMDGLRRAIKAGEPCPPNVVFSSGGAANRAIRRLVDRGVIEVHRDGQARKIRIVETGQETMWSQPTPRTEASGGLWSQSRIDRCRVLAQKGLSIEAIAERLGVPYRAVSARLIGMRQGGVLQGCPDPANKAPPPPTWPLTRRHAPLPIVTTANRPQDEVDQIKAFLEKGKIKVLPPGGALNGAERVEYYTTVIRNTIARQRNQRISHPNMVKILSEAGELNPRDLLDQLLGTVVERAPTAGRTTYYRLKGEDDAR